MAYHDALFPTDISYGSVGGPGFSTSLITTDSGVTEAVARWSRPRRRYDVAYGLRTHAQVASVRDHYTARLGPANTFPFKAPLDFTTDPDATPQMFQGGSTPASTDVLLGVGDGTTTDYPLRQAFTSGSQVVYVPITKPDAGTVLVSIDDVPQGSGWSVNALTGIVTFVTPPVVGEIVKAGCEFFVPVRYAEEMDLYLPLSADDFSSGSIRSITLVEDIDGSTIAEDFIYRGGGRRQFSSDLTIVSAEGCAFELVPAGSGLSVIVEAAADRESGGPHYFLWNNSADSLTLKGGATTIGTLAAGDTTTLVIFIVSGAKTWKALTG